MMLHFYNEYDSAKLIPGNQVSHYRYLIRNVWFANLSCGRWFKHWWTCMAFKAFFVSLTVLTTTRKTSAVIYLSSFILMTYVRLCSHIYSRFPSFRTWKWIPQEFNWMGNHFSLSDSPANQIRRVGTVWVFVCSHTFCVQSWGVNLSKCWYGKWRVDGFSGGTAADTNF